MKEMPRIITVSGSTWNFTKITDISYDKDVIQLDPDITFFLQAEYAGDLIQPKLEIMRGDQRIALLEFNDLLNTSVLSGIVISLKDIAETPPNHLASVLAATIVNCLTGFAQLEIEIDDFDLPKETTFGLSISTDNGYFGSNVTVQYDQMSKFITVKD